MFLKIKGILYAVGGILLLTLSIMVWRWFDGIQAENRNLQQAVGEYQTQVTALEIEKQNNESVIENLRHANEIQAVAIKALNEQFDSIRDERETQKRVLEGSRLGRIAAQRAGLIEQRANIATQERFKEFEGVINENF